MEFFGIEPDSIVVTVNDKRDMGDLLFHAINIYLEAIIPTL
jgi:hypothetical protein